jgi:hypothetical protein
MHLLGVPLLIRNGGRILVAEALWRRRNVGFTGTTSSIIGNLYN